MAKRKGPAVTTTNPEALRQHAEDLALGGVVPTDPELVSGADTHRMLHELRVHQIELELQNEELRRTQLELDAARVLYFDLYDLAPVGYCTVGATGHIVQANLTAAILLGQPRGALVNKLFSQFVARTDQDIYYLLCRRVQASGTTQSCEIRMLKKDRTPCWVQLAATLVHDGAGELRIVLSDITGRKHTEEALVSATVLQQAIFNSANFASIATDARGVIQVFNVGAEHMLGFGADEVVNVVTPADISDPQEVIARARTLSAEFNTPIAPGFEALVFKASRGIEDIYELTCVRKNGSRFPALVSITALRDADERIIGFLLIYNDNTARQRVDAERALFQHTLEEKNAELSRAIAVADKANLAKSEFLSSMSHELRTPLSAILGFAQLIEAGTPAPTPRQKRSIDQILQAGWYLLELINEILDLALIESGRLALSLEPVVLADVLLECQALTEPQATTRGIAVSFPALDMPGMVSADRMRLKQVVINLVSNAIKYNRAGGSVVIDCMELTPGYVRLQVRDTGEGMTEAQMAQLFQPFNRLGQETSIEQGTGIGLVVSKRLTELMGGVIGVESTVGEGSVFWIDLGSSHEHSRQVGPDENCAQLQAGTPDGSPHYTLLHVEDNPANLALLEEIIARRPDIELLSAADGIRGIEMARAFLPDVIVMDINLPGISGVTALRTLADDPATAHIPVLALSANAMPHDIETGLASGFFRYLTKPLKIPEFLAALDVALAFAAAQAKHPVPALS